MNQSVEMTGSPTLTTAPCRSRAAGVTGGCRSCTMESADSVMVTSSGCAAIRLHLIIQYLIT